MQRLARRAKPTRDALVEALRGQPVVYADETGWKQGGRRVWLWVFTNLREMSMRWQCELLGVNRSSLYYEPVEPDGEQLALMRRMDELHLKHPFFGSRMMTQTLKAEGSAVNRKRVQRLMRLMGLESTAPKPNNKQASAGTRRIPLSTEESDGFSDQSGVGRRHHIHPDGAEASYTWWRSSIAIRGGCSPGACPTRWRRPSAWRL